MSPNLRNVIVQVKHQAFYRELPVLVFGKDSAEPRKVKQVSAKLVKLAFDDKVDSKVKDFWSTIRQKESPHSQRVRQHPFYAMYGEELSKAGYQPYKEVNTNPTGLMQVFQQIIESEADYKDYLEKLAVDIVSEIWKCPKELFEAHLGNPPALNQGQEEEEQEQEEEEQEREQEVGELDPADPREVKRQADKRILMNTLTHGAAVHQMTTAHHLGRKQIANFDEDLLGLYDLLAKAAHKSYWQLYVDPAMIGSALAGTESLEWKEDGEVKIIAYGLCFPVLLQELSKGVMELLTAHGLSKLDPKVQAGVIAEADRMDEEQWPIQIGPELWRRFLKALPKDVSLSDLIPQLSLAEPEKVQEIIEAVVDNPGHAQSLLQELLDLSNEAPEAPEDNEDNEGWKREAQVTAPAPVKTPTVTPTRPRIDPFRPPKPAVEPKPKAKKKEIKKAASLRLRRAALVLRYVLAQINK